MKTFLLASLTFALLLAFPGGAHALVEISDGSVKALYHMDGSSADSSGNSHTGTDSNVTYGTSTCKLGSGCANFNGTNSQIPTSGNIGISGTSTAYTLGAWFQTTSSAASDYFALQIGDIGFNQAATLGMSRTAAGDFFSRNGVTDWESGAFATGTWQFATVEYDGTNPAAIYVNNVLRATSTVSANIEAQPFQMGCAMNYHSSCSNFFPGILDEVFVMNRVLTSDERTALYNGGTGDTICVTTDCDTPTSTTRKIRGVGITR